MGSPCHLDSMASESEVWALRAGTAEEERIEAVFGAFRREGKFSRYSSNQAESPCLFEERAAPVQPGASLLVASEQDRPPWNRLEDCADELRLEPRRQMRLFGKGRKERARPGRVRCRLHEACLLSGLAPPLGPAAMRKAAGMADTLRLLAASVFANALIAARFTVGNARPSPISIPQISKLRIKSVSTLIITCGLRMIA